RRPARPVARADDARGQGGGVAHARRRRELGEADEGVAAGRSPPRRAPGRDDDRPRGRAGSLLRHEHRTAVREHGRGRQLDPARRLPALDLVGRGRDARLSMAELHLPPTLQPLFPDLPRRVEVEATTVVDALRELDERWPGVWDRLCEPGPALRTHIHVYVDRDRAALETPLERGSLVHVIAAISGG